MDFGKVDIKDLGSIDFALPQDDPRTWIALGAATPTLPRIGVGAPVWSVKDWVGSVYPSGTPTKDFLVEYAKQFNSIELNSTHYGTPDPETIKRWRDSTPEGFKFNVKFLQEISHRFPLGADSRLVTEFCDAVLSLEDRLGISFLQLSPNFSVDDVPQLKKFLSQLPRELPISVEVRHPSFFREHLLAGRYYDVLREHGAHAVITDVAGRRDVLHTSLPTSKVLIRFIGNSWAVAGSNPIKENTPLFHPTDEPRVVDWANRLKSWLKLGLEQVEFFVHQPDNKLSPELISKFIERMNEGTDLNLPSWKPVKPAGPAQLKFF